MRRDVGYRGSVLRLQIWDTAGPERYPAYREYVSTCEYLEDPDQPNLQLEYPSTVTNQHPRLEA